MRMREEGEIAHYGDLTAYSSDADTVAYRGRIPVFDTDGELRFSLPGDIPAAHIEEVLRVADHMFRAGRSAGIEAGWTQLQLELIKLLGLDR